MKPFPLILLVACIAGASARAANISEFSYGGSGCPQGSVSAVLAPDGSALTIIYGGFTANVNAAQRADAKDCRVDLKIAKNVLQALMLDTADFRGFVGLEAGVAAQQRVDVQSGYGQFVLNQGYGFAGWQGPVSQNYLLQSVRPLNAQVNNVIDCANQLRKDTKLSFHTQVSLQSQSGGQGMFTVDSTDGKLRQIYRFRVVNCLSQLPFPFPWRR